MAEDDPNSTPLQRSHSDEEREWRRNRAEVEQRGIAESKKVIEAGEAYQARLIDAMKRRSNADRTFIDAVKLAKQLVKDTGLEGEIRPYYEIRYTVAQGIKAAIHGREDISATLLIQREILRRLDDIKVLIWIVIIALGFLAYKLF